VKCNALNAICQLKWTAMMELAGNGVHSVAGNRGGVNKLNYYLDGKWQGYLIGGSCPAEAYRMITVQVNRGNTEWS